MAAVAVVLLAASAAVGGCGGQGAAASGAEAAQGGQGYVAGDGSTVVLPIAERKAAPALNGTTLTGQPWSLADQLGHVTVANICASWCAPCREEIPTLQRLARDNPRMKIIGVNVQDEPAAAQAFVSDLDVTWPSIVDPSGEVLSGIPGVPPKALPSTIVIDAQGRIAARVIGPVTPAMVPKLVAASKGN